MATADKLTTVAENVPKVYHAGQLNVVENAKCLKGSKTGTAMLIDDVSPVEHTMTVKISSDTVTDLTAVKLSRYGKNLFTLENRQQVNFGKTENTTQRTFIENSFYYKVSANNYHNYTTSKYEILGSNSFEITSTNAYGLGVNFKVKPNETYTLSYNVSDSGHSKVNVGCYDKDGKFIKMLTSVSTFTIPDDCEWMVICFCAYGSGGGVEYTFTYSNIQLELGTTATDYKPYIGAEYTPTADGTVEGVTSLYPNTTLLTDTDGIIIDCDYYKDIDKAFNELSSAIALSGGE